MTIREATADDIDDLRAVAKASWDADYPDILSRESIDEGFDDWYSPEQMRESFNWANTLILVHERDDEVVGFAHLTWDKEKRHGDVLRLYVHPDHREEGLGTRLFEAVREAFTEIGVDQIRAMVLEDNDLGNAFYDRLGFDRADTERITIGDETYRETTYVLDVEAA